MSLIRKLVGQTAIYGLGHILSRVLLFVVLTSYLTRKFSDTLEYGIYSDMYAYVTVLIVLLSYRMDTAFFRFGSKEGDLQRAFQSAFLPLVMTTVVFIALAFMFSDVLIGWIGYQDQEHYIKWFAMILGFDILVLLPYAKLRLQSKPAQFMGFKILNILITISLIFFFFEGPGMGWSQSYLPHLQHEVDFVFLANLISSAIMFLILLPSCRIKTLQIDWTLWKKMVSYSWPLIIVGVAGSFNQFFAVPLQKFLLGNSLSENLAEAGIYSAPMRIASLLALFTTAFNYAAEPFFFKNADKKESKELYGKICLLFVMVTGIIVIGINFYMEWVQFLIGKDYREGLVIVPILLFSYLLLGIYYNTSIWYKLSDKTIYGALVASIGAAVTLVFSTIFLPKWGYIASAWASLLTYFVMNVLVYFLGQKHYPIQYPIAKIMKTLALILAMVMLGQLITDQFSLLFGRIVKTLLILVYIAIIYWAEKEVFDGIFSRSKSSSDP